MSSKAKKSRPVSTAAISHPQVYDSSSVTASYYFSPDADLFALLSLAVDKHRLRIFNAVTGSALAELIVDDARVTNITWALLDLSANTERSQKPRAKRKKTTTSEPDTPPAPTHIVVLGLSNGSLLLFSPTHGRVLRTLTHPSSLAAVLATSIGFEPYHIWSSSEDGMICLWNASRNELLSSWKNDSENPYSALALRPRKNQDNGTELLVANYAMRVLSLPESTLSASDPLKPDQLFSFTGHASTVSRLQWDTSQPSRFISTAEADRFVHVWCVPDAPAKEGTIVASVPLDASVRHAALSSTGASCLLTVSASGRVAIFELPSTLKGKIKAATLSPCTTISTPSMKGGDEAQVVAAAFVPRDHGSVRVARLRSGVRPFFEIVRYLNDTDEFISQVTLSKDISTALAMNEDRGANVSQKRYTEASTLAITSGLELGQDPMMDDIPSRGIEGDLDVDLAELSLGQRLTALTGADVTMNDGSSADEAASPAKARRRKKSRWGKEADSDHLPVPAYSLSRTLVQALHSEDTRLLETCLTHSDEKLVLNTVRRLPPQLAVPLLNACVERLGRGARAGTGKGGGGGASAQRGTGLIRWVRAVLVVHTAHLMTIPDVVARLSGLHATLTARLALRDPLLSLSGRLDLVLSQIEMRSSIGPPPIAAEGKTIGQKDSKRGPVKYVEGESESEDEEGGGEDEMEVEKDQDAGSIEDVELGGESGSDEEEEGESLEEDEEVSAEDEESDERPRLNGFIDDEAEEWSEDEEEDDGAE